MRSGTRLYTWLDVESKINKQKYDNWPPEIKDIQVFADGVDVFLRNKTDEDVAKKFFSFCFGDWYDNNNNLIYLESTAKNDRSINVVFIEESFEGTIRNNEDTFRPFFGELALFNDCVVDQLSKLYINPYPSKT